MLKISSTASEVDKSRKGMYQFSDANCVKYYSKLKFTDPNATRKFWQTKKNF